MMKFHLLAVIFIAFFASKTIGQNSEEIVIGNKLTIQSKILNQDREIYSFA